MFTKKSKFLKLSHLRAVKEKTVANIPYKQKSCCKCCNNWLCYI